MAVESVGRATNTARHVLHGFLAIAAVPWLWEAWLNFRFVLAGGGPPDEMDWDSDKHATVGLLMMFGAWWVAAVLGALGLFIYLWNKAPDVRWRAAIWIALLVATDLIEYDRRHSQTPGPGWQVRSVAAFLFAALATGLPLLWTLLLMRRQLDAWKPRWGGA